MAIGAAVRGMFGAHERRVTDLYRAIFVDIGAYADLIRRWVPQARDILEVGCGEGAITERLAELYPEARITAIDISARAGRLYRGRSEGVVFRQITAQEIAVERPGSFDLVLLSDVLHHVPDASRAELLNAVGEALQPDGAFLFKDWERRPSLIHWMCYASDRWLTGDRVRFLRMAEASELIEHALPHATIAANAHIRPWRNNYAMLVRA